MFVVAFIYVCCAVLIVVGELLPVVGDLIPVDCQRQCQVQRRCLAWFFKNIGYLWLAVGHCCLIIPYAVLRLRRLARKKVASFFVSVPCMVHPQRYNYNHMLFVHVAMLDDRVLILSSVHGLLYLVLYVLHLLSKVHLVIADCNFVCCLEY